MENFMGIAYLKTGSAIQQKVYKALRELSVFERLSRFTPVLAGTFPLGIDIEGSDLDILCEVYDSDGFIALLLLEMGCCKNFSVTVKTIGGMPAVIGRFEYSGLLFEIFGQPKPVAAQQAYLHLLVECYLLQGKLRGRESEIKVLKRQGKSTEAAFAALLGIEGDPYKELIALGRRSGVYP